MLRPRLALALPVCLLAACDGCTWDDIQRTIDAQFPTITRVAADGPIHETPFDVTVEVQDAQNEDSPIAVFEVRAEATSLADASLGGQAVLDDVETIPGGARYRGEMAGLPLGRYTLEIEAVLHAAGEPVPENPLVLQHTTTITVGESAACFTFQDGDEGWGVDGVWDIHVDAAEPDGTAVAYPLGVNCSVGTFQGAAILGTASCLPTQPEPSSGRWALDLVSPGLSDDSDWQSAVGVAFGLGLSLPASQENEVQPIVVRGDVYYAPGTPGNRIFHPLADGSFQWLFGPAGGEVPEQVRLRTFLDPYVSSPEGTMLRLQAVCPITGV